MYESVGGAGGLIPSGAAVGLQERYTRADARMCALNGREGVLGGSCSPAFEQFRRPVEKKFK